MELLSAAALVEGARAATICTHWFWAAFRQQARSYSGQRSANRLGFVTMGFIKQEDIPLDNFLKSQARQLYDC